MKKQKFKNWTVFNSNTISLTIFVVYTWLSTSTAQFCSNVVDLFLFFLTCSRIQQLPRDAGYYHICVEAQKCPKQTKYRCHDGEIQSSQVSIGSFDSSLKIVLPQPFQGEGMTPSSSHPDPSHRLSTAVHAAITVITFLLKLSSVCSTYCRAHWSKARACLLILIWPSDEPLCDSAAVLSTALFTPDAFTASPVS